MSIIKQLVDLQLEAAGYNVDYEHVLKNPIIEGVNWYEYYMWKNEDDYENFATKAKILISKHTKLNPRMDFSWFDGVWGLSAGYLDFVKTRIENDIKKNATKKERKNK